MTARPRNSAGDSRTGQRLTNEGDGLSSPSSRGDAFTTIRSPTRCRPARAITRAAEPAPSALSRLLAHLRRLLPKPLPLGARGERHAARYLRAHGFRILARNLRVTPGEADLVALDPDRLTIVIVEVKTRLLTGNHPPPEESITLRKRRKLLAVARAVAEKGRWQGRPLRIDVIAIDWPAGRAKPTLRYYPGAVAGGDDRHTR